MSDLPYSDPSNPALPSPLFSDVTAVRGDHMRANNAAIFADLNALNTRNPELVALTSGSFKTAALANANTYNGRSLFTCTAGVSDTPSAAAWRIVGYWNPTDSSGRFVAMADTSLETWEINYSGAAWGTWTQLTDSSGNLTRDVIGDVTGDVTGHSHAVVEANGAVMRWKIINIGTWNMSSSGSESKTITHGITTNKIRTVNVVIFDDESIGYALSDISGQCAGGYYHIAGTSIILYRTTSSLFYSDGSEYNDTSINRGYITIGYVD